MEIITRFKEELKDFLCIFLNDLSFLHVSTHRIQRLFFPRSFCRIQQNFLQISSMLQHISSQLTKIYRENMC